MSQQDNVLRSAGKLFTVLEQLKQSGGMGVTALADALEMPKSTVQVCLNTLVKGGFVVKRDGEYAIGLRFLEYGMTAAWDEPILPEARTTVDELAEETGELAACFVEEDGEAVYVYGTEGRRSIRTDIFIGDRAPLHSTASGKAILAHLGEARIDAVLADRGLPKETADTIVDGETFREELATIREHGHAYAREESIVGMRAVAAPVRVADDVVGSISIAGPANRFVGERFETELPELVKGAANELELRLTYSQSGV